MISLQGKTNFFEERVGEYSKSGVGVDRANQTFALDASFQLLTPNPSPSHFISLCLHVIMYYSVPSWNTTCPSHPPTLCFLRLYGKQYTQV